MIIHKQPLATQVFIALFFPFLNSVCIMKPKKPISEMDILGHLLKSHTSQTK